MPLLVNNIPLRPFRVGITQSNISTPRSIPSLLKKKGVKHIYARAVDDVHKTVLEAVNVDSILTPEKEAARSLVQLLDRCV